MNNIPNNEIVPVILRQNEQGEIIALLPTIPVQGINTAIVAFNPNYGWFTSDTSVMHSTSSCESLNTWPIISELIQKQGIAPIKIVKRITSTMDKIRLDKARESCYTAQYA